MVRLFECENDSNTFFCVSMDETWLALSLQSTQYRVIELSNWSTDSKLSDILFVPCISSIKNTFIDPTDPHYYKIIEMLKQLLTYLITYLLNYLLT